MQIKDLLVQLDPAAPTDARLDVAVGLARRHGAHLIGLCALDVVRLSGFATGMTGSGNAVALAMLVDQVREEALQAATRIEADFRERLRREGIEDEWRLVEDRQADTLTLHARYADLAVLGQDEPGAPAMPDRNAGIEQVLFSSG